MKALVNGKVVFNTGDDFTELNIHEPDLKKESEGWKDIITGIKSWEISLKNDFEYYYHRGNKYYFRNQFGTWIIGSSYLNDFIGNIKYGDIITIKTT